MTAEHAAVEVWWASPDDAAPAHAALLDDAERARAARYRHDVDRRRFVVGAMLARAVVGQALGVPVAEVRLDRTCARCGRPHGPVRGPAGSPWLSVAHAGRAVVVAACAAGPVGVDVEPADVSLAGVPAATASDVRTWVAKEALLKATGEGLRLPMEGLELDADLVRVRSWRERPDLAPRARLSWTSAGPAGHLAAVGGWWEAGTEVREHEAVGLLARLSGPGLSR